MVDYAFIILLVVFWHPRKLTEWIWGRSRKLQRWTYKVGKNQTAKYFMRSFGSWVICQSYHILHWGSQKDCGDYSSLRRRNALGKNIDWLKIDFAQSWFQRSNIFSENVNFLTLTIFDLICWNWIWQSTLPGVIRELTLTKRTSDNAGCAMCTCAQPVWVCEIVDGL